MEQLFRKFFTWTITYWNILTDLHAETHCFSTVIYIWAKIIRISYQESILKYVMWSDVIVYQAAGEMWETERVQLLPLVFASLFVEISRAGGGGAVWALVVTVQTEN